MPKEREGESLLPAGEHRGGRAGRLEGVVVGFHRDRHDRASAIGMSAMAGAAS
nr:hypothetical protein [Streptomyces bluensis]